MKKGKAKEEEEEEEKEDKEEEKEQQERQKAAFHLFGRQAAAPQRFKIQLQHRFRSHAAAIANSALALGLEPAKDACCCLVVKSRQRKKGGGGRGGGGGGGCQHVTVLLPIEEETMG